MSAALALPPGPLVKSDLDEAQPWEPIPTHAGRPTLRLVPTGSDVGRPRGSALLTRRGRLVRAALASVMALAVAWSVGTAVAAGAAQPRFLAADSLTPTVIGESMIFSCSLTRAWPCGSEKPSSPPSR